MERNTAETVPSEVSPQPIKPDDPNNGLRQLENTMESIVRVTLAGLGGAMLGLAQERRFQSMRVVTGAAATAAARRKRSPTSQQTNLPLTWAISCLMFCAIVETSRLTSPTSKLLGKLDDANDTAYAKEVPQPVYTVVDYTVGGAVGGLASSLGRHSQLRKQLPSSLVRGNQRFFFLGPGIGLGLVAGIFQAIADESLNYVEAQQQQTTE
eukprot:Nitzschia sp. Nitz4//scaffold260_size33533//7293//7922//NITZ4_007877-RA/size33533-processed-gene-0.23-mRNA-1//-1//CDS//3329544677//8397//frame0